MSDEDAVTAVTIVSLMFLGYGYLYGMYAFWKCFIQRKRVVYQSIKQDSGTQTCNDEIQTVVVVVEPDDTLQLSTPTVVI